MSDPRKPRNGPKVRCACGGCMSDVAAETRTWTGHDESDGTYRRLRRCRSCGSLFSSVESFEKIVRPGTITQHIEFP